MERGTGSRGKKQGQESSKSQKDEGEYSEGTLRASFE